MKVSYMRDSGIGCVMRSILTDDFGNNSCVIEREWVNEAAYREDPHHVQYCVSHDTMNHLYRVLASEEVRYDV